MSQLRVGILTYHFSENFGALMQAYGLKHWLEVRGHHAEFINYHPSYVEEGGNFSNLFNFRHAKKNLKIAYLKLMSIQRKFFGNSNQMIAFDAFRRDELGVVGVPLRDEAEVGLFLMHMTNPFDLLVCGSDQIWNPSVQKGLDPVYFLQFSAEIRARKISYAPSFGSGSLDPRFHQQIAQFLTRLDGLSSRERSGVKIVEQLSGRKAAYVPDPTILLGDFSDLVGKSEGMPGGHVFCYALRTGKRIREVAELVGGRLNAEVLSPHNAHRRWKEIGRTVFPSPTEWVSMIARSGFVVTNSFHGTVFSILLRKPFIVVGLPGAKEGMNERALNLLSELGLGHRFVGDVNLVHVSNLIDEPIDWSVVEPLLRELQNAGASYLDCEIDIAVAG